MGQLNLRRIYTDNSPQQLAVKGLVPTLAKYFAKHNIPLTEKIIYRHCSDFRDEAGASFVARTKILIYGLGAIGRSDRAEFLQASFDILPDSVRRRLALPEWIGRLGVMWGELIAAAVSGNLQILRAKSFAMRELLAVEVY